MKKIQSLPLLFRRILFVALSTLIIFTVAGYNPGPAQATNRVVTIYADDNEKTISVEADTVADALAKAGIKVGDKDLVEPSLDTEIKDAVFRINVYRARPVTIVDGETTRKILSPYRSERLIAADAGIKVFEEDEFILEQVQNILESGFIGQRLTIKRAHEVNINLYGTEISHRTHSDNVADVLEERGIKLKENDKVQPTLDAEVYPGDSIKVIHVNTEIFVENKTIPFETETIYDSSRMQGTQEITKPGQNGKRVVTYEVVKENDRTVSRKKIQDVVTSKPTNQVVVVGTRQPDPSSNIAIGQTMAASRGWTGAEWSCLYNLWQRESNWNHLAENPSSGAYGIPQSLPATKMASAGSDYLSNPATQIKWGMDYISARYGSPCGAMNFWHANNWY